jgi:leucyl aminopeptidase
VDFSIRTGSPDKLRTGCVVAGIFAARRPSAAAQAIDRATGGLIGDILKRGDFEGRPGSTLMLARVSGTPFERVLLVGLGAEADLNEQRFREAVRAAVLALRDAGARDALVCLPDTPPAGRDMPWAIKQTAIVALDTLYRFDRMKSAPDRATLPLRSLALRVGSREAAAAGAALEQAVAIGQGMALARDLGNLPPNVCTPSHLATEAAALARAHRLGLEVLDQKDMQRLGMGALLAVARGSRQPPRLISLTYRGAGRRDAPVVLIGKGITFDTGGISLKPAAEMDEMKFDMCGAAGVLGAIKAAALMRLPLNVVAMVPATENMPGGNATRPGDIVTTLSGQTVEILNTDAEGRLILCDAMTYAERLKPAAVIDVATLTGACVIALGHVASGLWSNDDALAREVLDAGQRAWDRAWQLPLWDDYQEQLRSNFADFANIGGRPAGSITAACYLSRFARKYPWAHLDIAGVAWRSGREKGATGRPVPLLAELLIARAGAGVGASAGSTRRPRR